MAEEIFRKQDIAASYIELAAELYFRGEFFAALGLAGMADDIFEAVLEHRAVTAEPTRIGQFTLVRDHPAPFSSEVITKVQEADVATIGEARPRKVIRNLLNRAKNSAKHGRSQDWKGFDLEVTADPEKEARAMICRAAINYVTRLHRAPEQHLLKFWMQFLSLKAGK